ncbi:XRE family transcriptional regulator [Rhodophyticola sp. CCM32]|uniref:helix-turn-helix transcriptional regulator n=1 Tax=Rhodophyticola sp. CCM32 TaxID=2916397 RepID=UPI00107EF9E2|nr:helix-turn-helix transcriptional regulator [Rhodophyticola sp. CCM32]QBY01738.1 XRE family transcriptional regulator [Rhodophyticola sp. CCM32]
MAQTVTIPRIEYDALLSAREDLTDIRAYDAAMAAPEESLPHAFMLRLIEGVPPVLVFREWRGLSQAALARVSGVNRVQISDIEQRGKTGSVKTLRKLADALQVPLDDLVP